MITLVAFFTDFHERVCFSESGWTDNEIVVYWFKKGFIPFSQNHHVDLNKSIILTLSGHESHETNIFKSVAYKHGIIAHAFPSKTTHKMQLLNVGAFSVLQHTWMKHCDKILANGVEVTHYNFIHEYMAAHKAITPEIVKKAFAKTGLVPLNPVVFNNKDFASSLAATQVTQAQALKIISNEIEQSEMDVDVAALALDDRSMDQDDKSESPISGSVTLTVCSTALTHPTMPLEYTAIIPPYAQAVALKKKNFGMSCSKCIIRIMS